MVKAAYSSGSPALGVGAGNTPAILDDTCDVEMAVSSILQSKTFDNGMICASEQTVVIDKKIYDKVGKEFIKRGAYICTKAEAEKLGKTIIIDNRLNAKIVGQPAAAIAKLAGFEVPAETKVLIAEAKGIGTGFPFSYEKLSPVLGMYKADNFDDALDKATKLIEFGGLGHTSILYTDPRNDDHINKFGAMVKIGRAHV